jgi:hypothetical protein
MQLLNITMHCILFWVVEILASQLPTSIWCAYMASMRQSCEAL